jgi:CheY-like chemotaxis protein
MARILVVDDEAHFRSLLCGTLSRMGHACVEAPTGPAALAACQPGEIDVVIADVPWLHRGGLEAIREMKEKNPQAGIIAMSDADPWSVETYLSAAQSLGAATLLAKPFSRDDIAAALNVVLQRGRA